MGGIGHFTQINFRPRFAKENWFFHLRLSCHPILWRPVLPHSSETPLAGSGCWIAYRTVESLFVYCFLHVCVLVSSKQDGTIAKFWHVLQECSSFSESGWVWYGMLSTLPCIIYIIRTKDDMRHLSGIVACCARLPTYHYCFADVMLLYFYIAQLTHMRSYFVLMIILIDDNIHRSLLNSIGATSFDLWNHR